MAEVLRLDYSVECAECGEVTQAPMIITTDSAAQKDFEDDGWTVVNGENRCPACTEED